MRHAASTYNFLHFLLIVILIISVKVVVFIFILNLLGSWYGETWSACLLFILVLIILPRTDLLLLILCELKYLPGCFRVEDDL